AEPTAQASWLAIAATPKRREERLGVECAATLQLDPFQCSSSIWPPLSPTAHTSFGPAASTARSWLGSARLGGRARLPRCPSPCAKRCSGEVPNSSATPTAHTSSPAIAATPRKLLCGEPTSVVGTSVQPH